jgi:hypothetical protein
MSGGKSRRSKMIIEDQHVTSEPLNSNNFQPDYKALYDSVKSSIQMEQTPHHPNKNYYTNGSKVVQKKEKKVSK